MVKFDYDNAIRKLLRAGEAYSRLGCYEMVDMMQKQIYYLERMRFKERLYARTR